MVNFKQLEFMKEDLIETLTSLLFEYSQGGLHKLLMAFSRVATREQEEEFRDQMNTFRDIVPTEIGIGKYFTLDKSSKIEQVFK